MNTNQLQGRENLRANIIREPENSLRDILNVIFRHKWKILIFFLLSFFSVTLFTFISPKIYQSDAKILIRVGRENISMDPTVSGPVLGLSQSRTNEVNSELSIIKSRSLAEQVVDAIGPGRFIKLPKKSTAAGPDQQSDGQLDSSYVMTPRKKAIRYFTEHLHVDVEKNSNIINLSFLAHDINLAQESLNLLLQAFLKKHIEVNRMQATPQFFKDQVEKLYAELSAKEQQLDEYKSSNNITSIESQKQSLADQIDNFQNSLDQMMADINSSEARIKSLKLSLTNRSGIIELGRTTGLVNNAADAIKERLLVLKLEEADLSERYQNDYRPLVDIRNQIKLTEAALNREEETRTQVTSGIDTNYQKMQLDLENEKSQHQGLIAQKNAISQEMKKRQQKGADLINHELIITRLQRDIQVLENGYIDYQSNLQRANISTAMDVDNVSNVSIVQPATQPMIPIKPNKKLNIFLGMFLGILGGLGLAFFMDYLDDTLKTNEDVEKRLGLPVLAAISKREFEACT